MKNTPLILLVAVVLIRPSVAELVPGGDFQMYKPGTDYSVLAEFGPGNSFARGVGDGIQLAGGTVTYSDGSPDGVNGDGIPDIDMPGWETVQGTNDLFGGFEGTTGMHLFAAWGGDGRIQTEGSLGAIEPGAVYTIRALVGGPDSGPIQGPLAFHLLADGDQLIPTESVDPTLPNGGAFQEISRTYDASATAGHNGAEIDIVIGVEDENDFANRVIFENVELEVEGGGPGFAITELEYAPETSSVILTWTARANENYIVKCSPDLSDWEVDLGDGISLGEDDEVADDGNLLTKTFDLADSPHDGLPELFFRVEVE
jgi:hypothetical protein